MRWALKKKKRRSELEIIPVNVWKQHNLKLSPSRVSIPEECNCGDICAAIAWTLNNEIKSNKI